MDIKPVTRSNVAMALVGVVAYFVFLVLFLRWVSGPLPSAWMTAFLVAVLVVLAIEMRAFHAKVRHEDGLEMTTYGAWSQGHAVVGVPAEEVPAVVLRVCAEDEDLGLTATTAEGGKVSTGMAFRSWGEHIRSAVEPLSDTRALVTATCRPAFLLGLTNWGRSEKYLYRFLSGLRDSRPAETSAVEPSAAATEDPAPRRRVG